MASFHKTSGCPDFRDGNHYCWWHTYPRVVVLPEVIGIRNSIIPSYDSHPLRPEVFRSKLFVELVQNGSAQGRSATILIAMVIYPAGVDSIPEVKVSPHGCYDRYSWISKWEGYGPPGEILLVKGHQSIATDLWETKYRTIKDVISAQCLGRPISSDVRSRKVCSYHNNGTPSPRVCLLKKVHSTALTWRLL